jgi:ferritin
MSKTNDLIKEYGAIEANAVRDFMQIKFMALEAGYDGLASLYDGEAVEDIGHSSKVQDFLADRGMVIEIKSVNFDTNVSKIKSYKDYLDYFLAKELGAVKFVSKIMESALAEKDMEAFA